MDGARSITRPTNALGLVAGYGNTGRPKINGYSMKAQPLPADRSASSYQGARRETGSPIHCAGAGTGDEPAPVVPFIASRAASFSSLSKCSTARCPINRVEMAAVAGETAMPTSGPTTGTNTTALAIVGAAITGATTPPASAASVCLPSASIIVLTELLRQIVDDFDLKTR
jgi:hypothetical protein